MATRETPPTVNNGSSERLSKLTIIFLIVALELGTVFAGQLQAGVVVKENLTSVNILAPLASSGWLHATARGGNQLPSVWDITIDFLDSSTTPACLTRSNRYQKQNIGVCRLRTDDGGSEGARPGGGQLTTVGGLPPAWFTPLSPPGYVLRL